MPEDFLFDNNCSSITESNRLTHIRYLSKREILFNMNSGIFSKVDLDYLDNTGSSEGKEEKDKNEQKQVDPTRTRINCFIHYNLFLRFDVFGLAQILDSNSKS
jgi:hypothetical protein